MSSFGIGAGCLLVPTLAIWRPPAAGAGLQQPVRRNDGTSNRGAHSMSWPPRDGDPRRDGAPCRLAADRRAGGRAIARAAAPTPERLRGRLARVLSALAWR